jgi:hypothetical protein
MHVKQLIWLAQSQCYGIGRKKLIFEVVMRTSLMFSAFTQEYFSNSIPVTQLTPTVLINWMNILKCRMHKWSWKEMLSLASIHLQVNLCVFSITSALQRTCYIACSESCELCNARVDIIRFGGLPHVVMSSLQPSEILLFDEAVFSMSISCVENILGVEYLPSHLKHIWRCFMRCCVLCIVHSWFRLHVKNFASSSRPVFCAHSRVKWKVGIPGISSRKRQARSQM